MFSARAFVRESTIPEDFDPIFTQQVLVVGGHAVNLWASYYAPRGDPELVQFAPFISKDGDIFLRDKEIAGAIAATAGWNFRENPEARAPVLGHIYLIRDGRELTVDVLHTVTGLTGTDLAATEALVFRDGRTYQLPTPDVMLKAKLANLAMHYQEERQDARHVRSMVVCCRHFLTDAYAAVVVAKIPEREAVDRFMTTLRVRRDSRAGEMDRLHTLNLPAAIPAQADLVELPRLDHLRAFYDHQIQIRGPGRSL